jgi:hypothetical protein
LTLLEKEVERWQKAPDTLRKRFLWFLKAPCPQSVCSKHLIYRHFTCLTCPERRYRANPNGKFRRYQRAMIMLESASGRGFILPKRYYSYGLFIPANDEGEVPLWKRMILKIVLTMAERVAEV